MGTTNLLPLELRMQIPRFNFLDSGNNKDENNLRLSLRAQVSKRGDKFLFETLSVDFLGRANFDKDEGLNCAQDREDAYIGNNGDEFSINPSVDTVFDACRRLYPTLLEASYKSGLMKRLVAELFAGVRASQNTYYAGWDQVLSKLVLDNSKAGKDLKAELDPSGKAQVIRAVSDYADQVKYELSRTQKMKVLEDSVYEMSFTWAFRGQNIDQSIINHILQSTDVAVQPFIYSVVKLLNDLGQNPTCCSAQLDFARSLDANYKAKANQALRLSNDLGYEDFASDVFDRVIQKSTNASELVEWINLFAGIKGEYIKYPQLASQKGELTKMSVRWIKQGRYSLQQMDSVFAAINNVIVPFNESTKKLVNGLQNDLPNEKDTLDFARSITPEYKKLASDILTQSAAAKHEKWGKEFFNSILQKHHSLAQVKTWQNMWSSIVAFNTREAARVKGSSTISNDWAREKIIDRAIEETWQNREFKGLEAIAVVARGMNTCGDEKGRSSLADCGGLSLFSNKPGKFFDPAFGGRYSILGAEFAGYLAFLSADDYPNLRWAMTDEFFNTMGPIWSKCSSPVFKQKSEQMKKLVQALVNETDQFKKWDLERQIKGGLEDCN